MSSNDTGDRGESVCFLRLTDYDGREEPWFRPAFLGAKKETFDYLVHLVDYPSEYFFVQVKSTWEMYTTNDPIRLNVQVTKDDIAKMVACPAPTYVIGIDLTADIGFLLSVNEERGSVTTLTTAFPLNKENRAILRDEVHEYWTHRDMILKNSKFKE